MLQNDSGQVNAVSASQIQSTSGYITLDMVKYAGYEIILRQTGFVDREKIVLERTWTGNTACFTLKNTADVPVSIEEIILFRIFHQMPPETTLYGEGFTMLSQTGGSLGAPVDIGEHTDRDHYKLPQTEGALTVYNMALLTPPQAETVLIAFTSCRRFQGIIRFHSGEISVVLEAEGISLLPGETWKLEEFMFAMGPDRNSLLESLAEAIRIQHKPRISASPPVGWSSWLSFGHEVTAEQVTGVVDTLKTIPAPIRIIQVDDGYQEHMGDWLVTRPEFGASLGELAGAIRARGFEPGLWVAPFIADSTSHLFQYHPEWFIRDDNCQPLRSDLVTFGGFGRGDPWYVLDCTHPHVTEYLEDLFRVMRNEWGIKYYKLDALFWAAMRGGRLHDGNKTRIEAYRQGLSAIRRAIGEDSFITAANHVNWASLGLIEGSRTSEDIYPTWKSVKMTSCQSFLRAWQNGRLWHVDPDSVLFAGDAGLHAFAGELSASELQYHWTSIFMTGGILLSGDDLTLLSTETMGKLDLMQPTGGAPVYQDIDNVVVTVEKPEKIYYAAFNRGETPIDVSIKLRRPAQLRDVWSAKELGRFTDTFAIKQLAPRNAMLLEEDKGIDNPQ